MFAPVLLSRRGDVVGIARRSRWRTRGWTQPWCTPPLHSLTRGDTNDRTTATSFRPQAAVIFIKNNRHPMLRAALRLIFLATGAIGSEAFACRPCLRMTPRAQPRAHHHAPLMCTPEDDGATHARSLYPKIQGDLRRRPASSAIALSLGGVGGAAVGVLIAGMLEGVLLGAAIGWTVASFGDTVVAHRQYRAVARQSALDARLLAEAQELREGEIMEETLDPQLRDQINRRLNRLL